MTLVATESLAQVSPDAHPLSKSWGATDLAADAAPSLDRPPNFPKRLLEQLKPEFLENPELLILMFQKLTQLNLEADQIAATLAFRFSKALHLPDDDFSFSAAVEMVRRLQSLNLSHRPGTERQAQLRMRMIMAQVQDPQLLAGLLALQLVVLEAASETVDEPLKEAAWSALHVFAPMAARLGIFWIKSELEDVAFRLLDPDTYQNLKKLVSSKRDERAQKVEDFSAALQSLMELFGLAPEIQGRYKRFYSIREKLRKVDNDFKRIQDLIGFRLLFDRVDECYAALGYLHEQWPPRKDRIKDYIAQPKANGYQSLHTTLELPDGEPIEVQIRTREMHVIAEYGVAAHWHYKEQMRQEDNSPEAGPPESPQVSFFPESLFTLTPDGDIIELPEQATALDFAYAVHTQVGNHTTGIKINDVIAKLDSPLKTGDCVTVMTSAKQVPNKEWLEFASTRSARTKIRHALREQQREQFRKTGWERLEQEFRASGLNLNRMVKEGRLEQECLQHRNQTFEHVLFCLGENSIRASAVLGWFVAAPETTAAETPAPPPPPPQPVGTGNVVFVDGLEQVPTRIARCCTPTSNDPIQGFLTEGGLVSIHHPDCEALQRLNPDRQVSVHWG